MTQRDEDSSERIESVDSSSLVSSSDSGDAGEHNAQSERTREMFDTRPVMIAEPQPVQAESLLDASLLRTLKHEWQSLLPAQPVPSPSLGSEPKAPPVLIVRTYSVRRGRKSEYRVESEIDDECKQRKVDDRKALRRHIARLMSRHPEICIDLSYHWKALEQSVGARTALVTGLLAGGSDKQLCIDLSNHRVKSLREGADVRYQLGMSTKAWRKAVMDVEAASLATAFGKEFARVVRDQTDMPVFSLVCHDQPVSTVVNPLLKKLARHGGALRGLDRLDLNRYSRSAEISEARPPGREAGSELQAFVLRLGLLLARTPGLRELCLRMNGLDAQDLAVLLAAGNQTLERLDLSCNPLCRHVTDGQRSLRGMAGLARHLRRDARLIELDLSACGIDAGAADLLLKGLARNRVLQKLDLSGNPVPPDHDILKDARVRSAALQAL